jgi:hypothetical protein
MGTSFGPLALGAGAVGCGRFLPGAMRFLPAFALASTLLLGSTLEADAARKSGWHGPRHMQWRGMGQVRPHRTPRMKHAMRTGKPAKHRKFRTAMRLGGPPPGALGHAREKNVQLASLGRDTPAPAEKMDSLSGADRITWRASPDCLADKLKPILAHVAANFGPIRVNSTCRSHEHNRRVGGAPRSFHLKGAAADFTLSGDIKGALAYLRTSSAGGIKHYGGGVFHIDTGPRRTW